LKASNRWRTLVAVVAALALATLACSPSLGIGAPTPPGSPVPVSTEGAGQLEGAWGTAVANTNNGLVTVVMTEEQLTSYAALKLTSDANSPIEDPQIYLRNGKLMLYGKVKTNNVTLPAALTLSVVPTAAGAVSVTIDAADVGPMPVPSALRDVLASNLNNLIAQNAGGSNTGFKVTDIVIADGKMTISGTLTQS
jgi:DUF2993 family protein